MPSAPPAVRAAKAQRRDPSFATQAVPARAVMLVFVSVAVVAVAASLRAVVRANSVT